MGTFREWSVLFFYARKIDLILHTFEKNEKIFVIFRENSCMLPNCLL